MEPLRIRTPEIHPDAFVASTARVFGDVHLAAGAILMFGAVVRAEFDRIEIGAESNIQDNAVVHCDVGRPTQIGRRVTVGHLALVHGATVGDSCLVGAGALALNGSVLGEGAWLAAGALLPEGAEIPPWTLAIGTPARPLRDLTPEEVARQDDGVGHYLRLAAAYRAAAG